MNKFKFYLSVGIVILFLLVLQFAFTVFKGATFLDLAQKQWDPDKITLKDLGFSSNRFIEGKNISKETIRFNNKKFLVVFIGNDQSYFDRKIVSNMFVYGPDIVGKTVLKDFQSITLSPREEKYFQDKLPALPFVEKIIDINKDGNPELIVNLGEYPGFGIRYTVLSYDFKNEDIKWLQIQDRNNLIDQAWFFEGYFDEVLLRFEVDQENSSIYQFVGVMPENLSIEDQIDLNNWDWRVDVFGLAKESYVFVQK